MHENVPFLLLTEAGIWLAKSAGVFLVAGLLCLMLRRFPASLRHTVWRVALVAVFLLPVLDLALPDYLGRPRAEIARPALGATPNTADAVLFTKPTPAPTLIEQPVIHAASRVSEPMAPTVTPVSWWSRAALAWLLGTAFLLVRLLASAWALRRLGRKARPALEAMTAAFHEACAEAGIRVGSARLRLVPGDRMPMTWGWRRPLVFLPEAAVEWEPSLLRSVLLHELTHVRRGDSAWDTAARVLAAVQWPNPFAWLAVAALGHERERACDAAVVSAGLPPQDYARHLLSVIAFVKPSRFPVAATAMARSARIEGRLRAILSPTGRKVPTALIVAVPALVLLAGGVAAVFGEDSSSAPSVEKVVAGNALESLMIEGIPYVPVDAFAERYGFATVAGEAADAFRLRQATAVVGEALEIAGQSDSPELRVGGVRVFCDDPVLGRDGRFYLSLDTVESVLDPVLRPADVALAEIDTVIIDAGHGGADPGGQAGGWREKDVTLLMAKELRDALQQLPLQVVLTRKSDISPNLGERAALARRYPRGLFLSLHTNSSRDARDNGLETYLGAERTAASTVLALAVHGMLLRETGTADGGVRARSFSVLRQELPSVLIETGYLTNDAERRRLTDEALRGKLVRALVEGIRLYTGLSGTVKAEDASNPSKQLWTRFSEAEEAGTENPGAKGTRRYPELPAFDWRKIPLADAFENPVGGPQGEGFYAARGFKENGHLGEDLNGKGGGNTDLGAPVRSIGIGRVILAKDMRAGWGQVIIIRHRYLDPTTGKETAIDSLYAYLDRMLVTEGQIVGRRQLIGTIGTNRGMYLAHLHFEIRKNLAIGMNRSQFPRDLENYHSPVDFLRTMPPPVPSDATAELIAEIQAGILWGRTVADAYLQAYLLQSEAQNLENADAAEAITKLENCRMIVLAIQEHWPEWQPAVVAYRLKETNSALARWRAIAK